MPDQSTRDLHIHLDIHIDGDEQWEYDHHVPVPPGYAEQDIMPFVQHEMDRAVTALQREEFGYARSADIIHQYDLRMKLIENLVQHAPRNLSRKALGALIVAAIYAEVADLPPYFHTRLEG